MNPRRKKRLTIILAISLGLASVTGLVLYALSQNIDLFYTPSELVEGKGPEKIKPEEGSACASVAWWCRGLWCGIPRASR
jgi:cytochrome c-type biogenesis protein CcmE